MILTKKHPAFVPFGYRENERAATGQIAAILAIPFLGSTYGFVVPFEPPTCSGMTSATASTEASRSLSMLRARHGA